MFLLQFVCVSVCLYVSAFLTLTKGQGHNSRSKVIDVEVSAFSECFLFSMFTFLSLGKYLKPRPRVNPLMVHAINISFSISASSVVPDLWIRHKTKTPSQLSKGTSSSAKTLPCET